jgi:glycosyltransferase involved in cell wall biosynthesis
MKLQLPSYISLHDNRVQYNSHISDFTAVTGCSETIAERAKKLLHREVEAQLYADIDSNVFSPKAPVSIAPQVASAKFKVFTVTRKDPVKNTETVIKATELLSKKIGSVAHVIAGSGSEEIAFDGVHLGLGPLSQQMIAEYINWCDCFLQVQYIPEISHAPAEALVIGKPVIITGNPDGIAQKVIDERRGILIPMEKVPDAEYIANALFECSKRKYDYAGIRKWAIERYGAEQQEKKEAERYTRLYSNRLNVSYPTSTRLKLTMRLWKSRLRYITRKLTGKTSNRT